MKLSKYIQVKISDNVTIWDSNEAERVEIGLDWDWSVQGSVVGAHPWLWRRGKLYHYFCHISVWGLRVVETLLPNSYNELFWVFNWKWLLLAWKGCFIKCGDVYISTTRGNQIGGFYNLHKRQISCRDHSVFKLTLWGFHWWWRCGNMMEVNLEDESKTYISNDGREMSWRRGSCGSLKECVHEGGINKSNEEGNVGRNSFWGKDCWEWRDSECEC